MQAQDTQGIDVLRLLARIAALVFETEQPLAHALEIVRQTALSHAADVSTLFVVENRTKLVLKAGVAFLEERELDLPSEHVYDLSPDAKEFPEPRLRRGLTPQVALSGKALYVSCYEDLIDKGLNPSHVGRWDRYIYPQGIDDPKTGFGCMYAVPLRRSGRSDTPEDVIGVFKIERRRNRVAFDEKDRAVFDLVAAHLGLIMQNLSRVQNRVFSDVAHAIGGGLGRTYLMLDTCNLMLKVDPWKALPILEQRLPQAIQLFDKALKRLDLVLEASRDPHQFTDAQIGTLLESIKAEVELKADTDLENKVTFELEKPISAITGVRLRSLSYHDLGSILGNLLDNAIRYATKDAPASFSVRILESRTGPSRMCFIVADRGTGIPMRVLNAAREANYAANYGLIGRLPGAENVRGTGLHRVFGLAKINDWEVNVETRTDGTRIEVVTPDLRSR